MALTDKLTAIADAIRGKTGGTETLNLDQMAEEIAGIESGSGSSGAQYETGTFIGDGTARVSIPVSFEPDFIHIRLEDLSSTLDANHVLAATFVKDFAAHMVNRAANSTTLVNGGHYLGIEGYYCNSLIAPTYADGVFSGAISPSARTYYNGASYIWNAGKW